MAFLDLTPQEWEQVAVSLLIVLAALFLTRPLLTFILDKVIGRITGKTKSSLDNLLIEAIRPPLYFLVVILVLQAAVNRLSFWFARYRSEVADITFVLYGILVMVVLWRLMDALHTWYSSSDVLTVERGIDERLLPFIHRILLALLVAITVIVLLGHFNIEISGLIATLGIGSLAVALAAQESLADVINGFVIMMDQPFRIGDRIEIHELNTWGDVVDIGLRSTRIRTLDNRMVIVPNSVIGKSLVVNHSYPSSTYRNEIEVGVAYGTDLELARTTLIEAVRQVEGVLSDRPVEALFLKFDDSALVFRVRWWLETYVDTRRMFDKVNTAMYNALNEAGVQIPFPQRDVHHKLDAEDAAQFAQLLEKSEKE